MGDAPAMVNDLGLAQAALFGSHQATELWTQDRPQMHANEWIIMVYNYWLVVYLPL